VQVQRTDKMDEANGPQTEGSYGKPGSLGFKNHK